MTIRRLKDGKWEVRLSDTDTLGNRVQRRRRFKYKHEAERYEALAKAQTTPTCSLTVAQFFDGIYKPFKENQVRAMTWNHYQGDFDRLIRPTLGKIRLDMLKPYQIQREIDRCESWGAARNLYKTLRQVLRRARALGYIGTVATDGVELERHTRAPIEVLSACDMPAYLEAVEKYAPEIAAGVCVSMMGARRSEVCALEWDDIDLGGELVAVSINKSASFIDGERFVSPTKTEGSSRLIYLPEWLGDVIRRHVGSGRVVPVEPDGYSYRWRKAVEAAGLPYISLKNLRHSVGTSLADAGLSMYDIQNLLGHDLITTTSRYYLQQSDGAVRRAAEAFQRVTQSDT